MGAVTGRRRLGGAVGAVLVLVLAGCAAAGQRDTGQGDWQRAALTDRAALFDSAVLSPGEVAVPVGESTVFEAFVCGPLAPAAPCPPPADVRPSSRPSGQPSGRQGVSATVGGGARLRAELVSPGSADVTVVGLGPDVQPLAARTDVVSWQWRVAARTAGVYDLTLVVTTLQGGTNLPLTGSSRISSRLRMRETRAHLGASALGWMSDGIKGVLGLLAAVGGIAGLATVAEVSRRRARRARSDDDATPGIPPAT
jgi:hypothetical protein